MNTSPTPTVDIEAPNGTRIVLRPVVSLAFISGVSRSALAVVVALCAIWLITSFNRINHTDIWGHLSFGRWIVEHGSLPSVDPFRSCVPEPIINIPWLSQVIGYTWHQALGLEGLVLAHATLVTLTAAGLMLAVRGRGVSTPWAVAAAVAGYLLALPITGTIRPQLFGMVGFVATLWAISRLPARRHPLLWLPGVFALWANLHGSFAVGLAALGCFSLGATWEAHRVAGSFGALGQDHVVRRAWLALLLTTTASCINPLGAKLLAVVAGFGGNVNLAGISEWQPMTITSLSGGLFICSLLITAVLLRWSPRRIWVTEVLLILLFGLGALLAIRMLIWWALVWPWVVAPHAAATWLLYRRVELVESSDEPHEPDTAPGRTLLVVAIVFATVLWSPPTFGLITGRCRPEESILSTDTPREMAEQVARRHLTGRIFTPMDWADYLLWRNPGAIEPLVYSHVHLTSPELWQDFLLIRRGDERWLRVADHYGLKYLVTSRARNRRLAESAARQTRCRVLHDDRQGLLIEIQ